ncbi:fumarylacetoacetate hydrolase domain-containing protein 2-like [Plakobranchus ocellatus]|uniref:Fumarylacetoacetate hydrolase domain-containing protein 2-like n=1 Tax=Plakobranchus ocellatus TaxID=259542 RepID=A0AAV3XYV1_9GAST|nr:fumarylacetoacetate hydrolase domain-containing protein 2-like [Plakobranchus ocellatus]
MLSRQTLRASRGFAACFVSPQTPVLKNQRVPFSLSSKRSSAMRFIRYETSGRQGLGVALKEDDSIFDLTSFDPSVGASMQAFIAGGEDSVLKAKKAIENGKNVLPQDQVRILAPISDPGKILCVGMNYRDHCEEQNIPVPKEPVIFSKFNNSIIGPNDSIKYPDETEELDWEVEFVIIIGKEGKNIQESKAMEYVFGYTVAHDVSARDWQLQRNGNQFLIGKSMDTFCPLGPAIVTKENIKDPHNLKLWTLVNGVTKQEGNTSEMVFKTEAVIAFISRFFTLQPGDIILTGTPPGVGVFQNPPEFLKRGDVVEVGVEGIGSITNKIE